MIFRLTKDTVYHLWAGEIFLIKLTLDYAYLSLYILGLFAEGPGFEDIVVNLVHVLLAA